MECCWHAQNLFHDDSPYTSSAVIRTWGGGTEGEAEWGHRSQALLRSLQGGGTQWYFAAVNPCNTCQSRKKGEHALLPSHDCVKIALLRGTCFFYNLIVILMHICLQGATNPCWAHALYFIHCTPISNKGMYD